MNVHYSIITHIRYHPSNEFVSLSCQATLFEFYGTLVYRLQVKESPYFNYHYYDYYYDYSRIDILIRYDIHLNPPVFIKLGLFSLTFEGLLLKYSHVDLLLTGFLYSS